MAIRVCVAGVSGWTGSAVARAILSSSDTLELAGAIARGHAGRDAGELLGLPVNGVVVTATLREALTRPADVLTSPMPRSRTHPAGRRASWQKPWAK